MDKKAQNDEHSPESNQESIKPKKRAPTALTVECGVCHGPAPDHVHFGARCCYSCRAFFRRTAPRSISLRCRSGVGKCEISSKNKKCISCRYKQCLLVGMDPHLVQGSRTKSGKDTDEEDVELTEEEPGGTIDKIDKTNNQDIPIIENTPKAKDTLQVRNISVPAMKFPATEIGDENYINQNSAIQQNKFYQKDYFSRMKSDQRQESSIYSSDNFNPSYGQYPYVLGENPQNAFNFGKSYEHRRRMSALYPYQPPHHFSAESRKMFTKGPNEVGPLSYVHNYDEYKSNVFMQYPMPHNSPEAPIPSNQPMQHNLSRRTSVIRSSKRRQPSELQYRADLLKHEGSILRHTGNLFSYHANLLEQERQQSEDKTVINQSLLKQEKNTEIKTELSLQTSDNGDHIQKKNFSEDIANEMFLEAQDLLKNSHWLTNITEMDTNNDYDFLAASSKYDDVDSISDLQFSNGELCEDFDDIHGSYQAESSAQRSVIQSHGLSSTGEKKHTN